MFSSAPEARPAMGSVTRSGARSGIQPRMRSGSHHASAGAAAVEFALATGVLCLLVIGGVEMSRLLWTVNSAVEATRLGARLAVVCDLNDPRIARRMADVLPGLPPQSVRIDYLDPPQPDNTCTPASCKAVRVGLGGLTHQTLLPFQALSVALPPLNTTLRRESMDSTSNEVCL